MGTHYTEPTLVLRAHVVEHERRRWENGKEIYARYASLTGDEEAWYESRNPKPRVEQYATTKRATLEALHEAWHTKYAGEVDHTHEAGQQYTYLLEEDTL